jgi:ParB family chromosome partitioning protein
MTITEIDIPLASIAGRSRLNPRQASAPPEKIEEIAATIVECGLIEPPLAIAEDGAYAMLNGGNRIDALRLLQARTPDSPIVVRARLFEGSEIEAREAAAAVSLTQTALHPVDKIEAFSAMAKSGRAVEDIARIFHEARRDVERHIRLAALSPVVLGLWRRGEITRDVAIAFTHGTIEAQEALIETRATRLDDAFAIARKLRADALDPDCAEARFLAADPARADRYVDNGGRIDEDLFSEAPIFLDAAIAAKTVKALLTEKAEKIAEAEDWGFFLVDEDHDAEPLDIFLDLRPEETERLAAIDVLMSGEEDDAARIRLLDEVEAIEARGLLRVVRQADRIKLGVRVELNILGRAVTTRAIPLAPPRQEPTSQDREPPAPKGKTAAPPPLPPTEKIGNAEKTIRVEAINAALRVACAEDATLAAVFLVAALGCQWGREGIAVASEGVVFGQPKSELLRKISGEKFASALLSCAQAAAGRLQAPITNAFAELIGRHIEVEDANPEIANLLLAVASRFDDIYARMADAFDYPEYFRAVGKTGAVDAIRDLNGEAAATAAEKSKVKPLLVAAAKLAKDKEWLPRDLATACGAKPEHAAPQSTAQAMAAAIDADEASLQKARTTTDEPGPVDNAARVRLFIEKACVVDWQAQCFVNVIVERFGLFGAARGWPSLENRKFFAAMKKEGFGKNGRSFTGLALKTAPVASGEEASDEDAEPLDDAARVRLFIEEACERVKDASVKAVDLAARYDPFGALRGFPSLGQDAFFAAMAANGFPKKYSSIKGLGLKDPAPAKGKRR